MVDAALSETNTVQQRLRVLPSRVVVYVLLAAALFADLGYGQVWARMCCGLDGLIVAHPTASALAAARRRIGVAPMRALLDLLRGPATGLATTGVYWRGRLVCAIDGTILCCADTPANLAVYHRGGGYQGGTGYPMVRVLALVACGTRTIIDVVFGTDRIGETQLRPRPARRIAPGRDDRAGRPQLRRAAWITALADTGADVLVRVKANRRLPVCRQLGRRFPLSRLGETRGPGHHRHGHDHHQRPAAAPRPTGWSPPSSTPPAPPVEIVGLYHERWEIETAFGELKSTTLGGRVLRARTPTGVAQEVYALLIIYQALRDRDQRRHPGPARPRSRSRQLHRRPTRRAGPTHPRGWDHRRHRNRPRRSDRPSRP